MKGLIKGFLELIYPPKCYLCGIFSEEPICKNCLSTFPLISSPLCQKCGKPTLNEVKKCRDCSHRKLYFSIARSLGLYEGNLKEAIQQLKYKNGKRLAPFLIKLLIEKIEPSFLGADLITWVPLSRRKEVERGYNQAALLAKGIIRILPERKSLPLLVQTKETFDQSKLSLEERKNNIRGAFSLGSKENLKGQAILLIDDVFTTGSTVNECSKVLLKGGAKEVKVLTLARATLNY